MLPSVLDREMRLFNHSPLSNKVFAVISSKSDLSAQEAAEFILAFIGENENLGLKTFAIDNDFLFSYFHYFPNLWNLSPEKQILAVFNKKEIKERVEKNIDKLLLPTGIFERKIIALDPLNILPVFLEELKVFNFSNSLDINGGFVKSKDLTQILLLFDYDGNVLDLQKSQKIKETFEKIKENIPADVDVFYMGAPRFTSENHETIIADIFRISIISIVLMIVLFLVFLRNKEALFIYFAAPIVIVFAGVITNWIFGNLSIITLGFGSVLMGLTVDYFLYMFFALKSADENQKFKTAQEMFKPITASAVTSIAAFLLLLFSGIEILRQTAVFCASGLIAALFISLFVSPFIFPSKNKQSREIFQEKQKVYLSYRKALFILFIIIASGVAGFYYAEINVSAESLNVSSKQLKDDREMFDKITGSAFNKNKMLFIFGSSIDEVLESNEKISALNPKYLKLSNVFPSNKTKEKNIENWKRFWDDVKINQIENIAGEVLRKRNLKENLFDNFYNFLKTARGEISTDFNLNMFFNPIINLDAKFAFVNIIPSDAQIDGIEQFDCEIISNDLLIKKIAADVLSRFSKIFLFLFICSFIVLTLIFRSLKLSLIAIAPPLCGISAFFAASALFGIEINLIAIYALPLLIGLGADYGVFMIYQKKTGAKLHPTKALVIAALSTIIGFGSLTAAHHNVLFIIGFMVCSGIIVSILTSIFVLPSLIKDV
ncbi:MAG: MMPL family transporter [Elusimicrobiota bacterium]|jgi:predicted exporter|nr:MMPL family transporter [Elusimicrobiota bacterium]